MLKSQCNKVEEEKDEYDDFGQSIDENSDLNNVKSNLDKLDNSNTNDLNDRNEDED